MRARSTTGRDRRSAHLPANDVRCRSIALRGTIARGASARYGRPLRVIENRADDPPRDPPLAFLEALRMALGTEKRQQATA
jgi:hypothetical protein